MNKFPMDADILSPSDDRIFKVLLTHPNAKQILIDVISSVIEQKVVDVHIRNNEIPAMDINEKNERLDVNCVIDTGDQINVEMHCNRQDEVESTHTNFINKYVYFLTDLHSSQESKGKIYRKLVKTYQITFCMYNVLPRLPDYKNWFTLRTSDGARLTDQINIIIIELSKISDIIKKPVEKQTSLEKWSLFFRYASERAHRKMINEIIINKEEIGMAATLLREISQDEHERARAMSRKKYEMDMYSDYHSAIEDGKILGQRIGMEQGLEKGLEQGQKLGMEKGLEQGLEQASIQIARNLLAKGSTPEFVKEVTGLSPEEITKLLAG